MRRACIIYILCSLSALPLSGEGQTAKTGQAQASGECNVVNTGNGNTFNISCPGFGKRQLAMLVQKLNTMIDDQRQEDQKNEERSARILAREEELFDFLTRSGNHSLKSETLFLAADVFTFVGSWNQYRPKPPNNIEPYLNAYRNAIDQWKFADNEWAYGLAPDEFNHRLKPRVASLTDKLSKVAIDSRSLDACRAEYTSVDKLQVCGSALLQLGLKIPEWTVAPEK